FSVWIERKRIEKLRSRHRNPVRRVGDQKSQRQRQRQRTGVSALHEQTRKCPGSLRISGRLVSGRDYSWLILARNSLLLPALASRSISNSIASTGDSGFSTLRSTQMRCKS